MIFLLSERPQVVFDVGWLTVPQLSMWELYMFVVNYSLKPPQEIFISDSKEGIF